MAQTHAVTKIESLTPDNHVLNFFRPGQLITWTVRLSSHVRDPRVDFTVKDWQGAVIQQGHGLHAENGSVRIECDPRKSGWFEITVSLLDDSGTMLDARSTTFTIEPEVHSAGRYFRYAISAHTAERGGADFDNEIRLLAESGADMVRMDVSWQIVQPSATGWNFESIDKTVNALAAHRIEFQGILGYTARWATTGDPNAKDPHVWSRVAPRQDAYLDFATKTVDRYRGRVRYWEIWNEPDISFWQSPTEKYTELFNAASTVIKRANPDAQVINGGFAMVSRKPNPNFIRDFLKDANTSSWDIWAYHDYHTFPQMLSRNREHLEFYRSKRVSIPTWINEGGFHTLNPGGEQEEAVALVKKYSTAPALGVSAYFWYDLRDDGTNPQDSEHHFGLAHYDFSPKPAFAAYHVVVDQLAEREFARQLPGLPDGIFAHLYRGSGANPENVLVLWREGKNGSTPLWLDRPAAEIAVIDLMGNRLSTGSYAGGSLVAVGDVPVYLHFRGSEAVSQLKPILSAAESIVLAPGASSELSVKVLNPTAAPVSESVSWQSTVTGIRFTPQVQAVTIPPGQSVSVYTSATLAASATGVPGTITIRAQVAGSPQEIQTVIRSSTAAKIPLLRTSSGKLIAASDGLPMSLGDRDHVHNLFSAEPSFEMHWHGPEDLSATAKLACDPSALLIDVDVRDDVHSQPNRDDKLWQGDSLQLAIRTGDASAPHLGATAALLADGSLEGWVDSTPSPKDLPKGRMGAGVPVSVHRVGDHTIYAVRVPWGALGLTARPADAFALNFIVNDDDGKGRKQWLQLSPGLGETLDPAKFNLYLCR